MIHRNVLSLGETIDRWQEAAEENLKEDGYLVIGINRRCEIGDVIADELPPFRIIADSTAAEYARQAARSQAFCEPGDQMISPAETDFGFYFYRVEVAD